jgi:hypothetical protein
LQSNGTAFTEVAMKAALKAIVPALALTAALALPSLAEAGHRHGRGCGHKGYGRSGYYYDDGYRGNGGRGHGGGYYGRPYGYGYSSPYRPYARRYYAPPPYGYGGYGYYPPPPPVYYGGRPRVGVTLHFGF